MSSAEFDAGPGRPVSRRRLLGGGAALGGAAVLGASVGAAVGVAADGSGPEADAGPGGSGLGQAREPFHGAHQAGIATPAQANAAFVALDLRPGVDRQALVRLMKVWTDDAVRLTDGRPALADPQAQLAGVPARLTITVGFGRGVLRAAGLVDQAPSWLRPLPRFTGDELQDRWSGGDLIVQVASEDPVTVSHTVNVLVGDATDFATLRWVQRGFHRPASTAPVGITGRNLMGQVDGTENPTPGTPDFDEIVWVTRTPDWLVGGTGLVVRRIGMDLPVWGSLGDRAKEEAIGRRLADGAPLTGGDERTKPDFAAVDAYGLPIIGPSAHIRLAHSETNSGKLLRRPYNYDDGFDPAGKPDSGLIFAAYMADVDTQFVPIQKRLSESDVMNIWLTPIGSAVFAVPPGIQPGQYLGQSLLG